MTPCRHCRMNLAIRPRGLCSSCYTNNCIRLRYRSFHKQSHHGYGEANTQSRQPAEATQAPAGSREKMCVMQQRAMRGESLFHPGDNSNVGGELDPFQHEGSLRFGEPTGLEDVVA